MYTLRLSLAISFLLFISQLSIGATTVPDTLSSILKSGESKEQQQQQIYRLCYNRFLNSAGYDQVANAMTDSVRKYELGGEQELRNFINILIHRRNFELEKAEELISKSIAVALQNNQRIFLYQFYLNQAYVQTDLGNALNAVYNYRLARRIAEEIGERDLFITTDIGISDIYTTIGLYPQAIIYLNQAQDSYNGQKKMRASSQTLIYLNKAEIYFKTRQLDSLRKYAELSKTRRNDWPDMDRNLKRLDYFTLILENKYGLAIPIIKFLLGTGNQYYKTLDRWHLAECYYHSGQLDSALATAKKLVEDPLTISSKIRLDSYKLSATIFKRRNQLAQANHYLELTVKESEDYTERISKIGDLASALRLDSMEANYHARNLIYKKERTILVMAVILTILALVAIIASYRNVRQKNRFQKLLHQARSRELAFINSHQVRKPLANILGICSLLEHQEPSEKEMKQYMELVQLAARDMDNKLKEVEQKLRAQA